jgi:hypothetical protein
MRMRYKLPLYVFLFLSPILVPVILVILSAWMERAIVLVAGDNLDQASRRLAGPNATNCGRTATDGDARRAKNCVLAAFRERRSFRVRYQLWDITYVDATKEVSLVGAPDGHVYELSSWFGFQSSTLGEDVSSQRCGEPIAFETRIDGSGEDRGMIECVWRRE